MNKSESTNHINELVQSSLQISTPAWPLQNTVAVNPFWFLRHQNFYKTIQKLKPILKSDLNMPASYYLNLIKSGEIEEKCIKKSIEINSTKWGDAPKTIEEMCDILSSNSKKALSFKTLAELELEKTNDIHSKIILDIGKYAAAFFDEKQATLPIPWKSKGFWSCWIEAQSFDKSLYFYGFKKYKKTIDKISKLNAHQAIEYMLDKIGLQTEHAKINYMQCLISSVLGWSSQFKYIEWQKNLGYKINSAASSIELLTVRMAYDFIIFENYNTEKSSIIHQWKKNIENQIVESAESEKLNQCIVILHNALEMKFQNSVSSQLNRKPEQNENKYDAQMIFCIDVRSEMIRRNIESINNRIKTTGFAGFFGIPFDFKQKDEEDVGHRLPVLLSPAFKTEEKSSSGNTNDFDYSPYLMSGYFKNLRKNPFSSFLFVELFGLFYIKKILESTFNASINYFGLKSIPNRFSQKNALVSQENTFNLDGSDFALLQKIDRAEAILKHLGLIKSFSKFVIVVGHGSATTNNAFGSSLDCGACGGHAGDINARFLADLLNQKDVRQGLESRNIIIPNSTIFLAALHETVTDQIYIFDENKISQSDRKDLERIKSDLVSASNQTSLERHLSRSKFNEPSPHLRSKNWSETRPEWGLAGNACFIVAPRSRTLGVNLNSRSFLHDYDWNLDQNNNYATLELIMTAPMVVTNWINMQYFASTVAPKIFGSGNKVLHNLVNETGVYEGNGGDLKIGLPIQSVHDGKRFIHEPLRLSVFIEAPRDQIEKIISKHEVVRQLIENEWLHLIHIDPTTLKCEQRNSNGYYTPIDLANTECEQGHSKEEYAYS